MAVRRCSELMGTANYFPPNPSYYTFKMSAIWNLTHSSSLFNEFVCKLGFFWHEWASLKSECLKGPRVPKKAQFTQERVEYNVIYSTIPLKAPNRLKSLKLS
jgi:hypothetical protein